MNNSNVRDENRMFAKYMFSLWALTVRNLHQNWERWSKELAEGRELHFPGEIEYLTRMQSLALAPEKVTALEREALEILYGINSSNSQVRQPGVKGIDDNWHVSTSRKQRRCLW